jgi:hypothetical protein
MAKRTPKIARAIARCTAYELPGVSEQLLHSSGGIMQCGKERKDAPAHRLLQLSSSDPWNVSWLHWPLQSNHQVRSFLSASSPRLHSTPPDCLLAPARTRDDNGVMFPFGHTNLTRCRVATVSQRSPLDLIERCCLSQSSQQLPLGLDCPVLHVDTGRAVQSETSNTLPVLIRPFTSSGHGYLV